MTKEMKRPTSDITQDSIKPSLSNAVEFYTNKNREAHKCIQERDEYINYLESKLSNAKQQQALAVVPEFIGEFINAFGTPEDGKYINYAANPVHQKELEWIDNHQKTWLTALLVGFTVEKPQLFYLKNKLTTSYLILDTSTGYFEHWGSTEATGRYKSSFTQQEIGSMETGSYEQIEVAE